MSGQLHAEALAGTGLFGLADKLGRGLLCYIADVLRIARPLFEEIAAHALAVTPEEACGILVGLRRGEQRQALRALACRNVHEGRRDARFLMDPEQHLAAQRDAREQGLEIVGYYHSHLNGSAALSEEDRRQAHPWVSNLILAFRGGVFQEARCWRVHPGGRCEEEPLEIAGATGTAVPG
ncbi:MAG: M67 family metallopeptidase [Bryobacteraceae bacterium]